MIINNDIVHICYEIIDDIVSMVYDIVMDIVLQ